MKKGVKVLGLVILGLVFTSMFVGVVSAADLVSPFIDKVSSLLDSNNSFSTFFKTLFSPEILFGLLIFLIVFAVISQISLFKEPWMKIALSIVVSVLAAGFISTDWIKPLVNQYTAIGLTISFVLPFALLFYFIKEIIPNNGLFQKAIWIIYFVIVSINAIMNWNQADSNLTKTLYLIIIILSLIMIFWSKTLMRMLFKEELKSRVTDYQMLQQLIREGDKAKAIEYARTLNLNPGMKSSIAKSLGIKVSDL